MSSAVGTDENVNWAPVNRSMLPIARRSRGSTRVIASPLRPARPVRPMRWMYASASHGTSTLMTWVTLSMSRPRAATSVAMSRVLTPFAEAAHHAVALVLVHVAMERLRAVAPTGERVGDVLRLLAGLAEHDRRAGGLHVEHPHERVELASGRNLDDALDHRVDGAARGGDGDADGILEEPLRERREARRHGGGEECELARLGERREQGLDVLQEAEGEHLVRLVEHGVLDAGQIEGLAVEVVHHATRGCRPRSARRA